jgi:chromosome segregation ATPase
MTSGDLAEIADQLYGLRPEEFTAARDAAVKQARSASDADLAKTVKALRRPSVAAWAVNLLVRRRTELAEQVVGLGDSLREAQSQLKGDALRELTRQRRQLVAAVTAETRTLAAEEGQPLTDAAARQVEETLQAAMADPEAAAAVLSGLLTQSLSSTGVGSLTEFVAVLPSRPRSDGGSERRPALTVVRDEGRHKREAEERLSVARASLQAATRRHEAQVKRRDKVRAKVLQLEAELEELRGRVADLESQTDEEAERLSDLDEEVEEAQAEVDDAQDDFDSATRALDALS